MTERARTELDGAVYRGEAEYIVQLLGRFPWPDHALQVIGDGLVLAMAAGTPGAAELASRCVAELDERGWAGDDELATELRARLGQAAPSASPSPSASPPLQPVPVNLRDLSDALEGDWADTGGRVDLRTGEVWPPAALEYDIEFGESDEDGADDAEDPDRWLYIDSQGSQPGYRDMQLFIDGLTDPEIADRLEIAIDGRGAFRRFKDVLHRWPEIEERWYAFSDERSRGRARAWLADEGYTPAPRPHAT